MGRKIDCVMTKECLDCGKIIESYHNEGNQWYFRCCDNYDQILCIYNKGGNKKSRQAEKYIQGKLF